MAQSALPYPSNPSLEQLKVLATDSVIYLSPSGNDGTGDGSLAKPYLTLQKCMDVARTYTIVGSATLYIRFLRGEYTINSNVDLYHPQGGNLIIEGDPAEFKQRYLWQVENYTWNIDSFAGGGHTGSIRLFDGVTATVGGVTMHGFTSADQGMYFTITNASVGSRSYCYASAGGSGINTGTNVLSAYNYFFAGDRFFNHGVSFEDSYGVLGIGRIIGATTSTAVLQVQFQNPNIDSRCPGLTWGGGKAGVNNTIAWAGVPSNYPEPQYSQPNGYYGTSTWKSDTQQSVSYPSNTGQSYNTIDAYVLSTYPVVIRASTGVIYGIASQSSTLFLKNGTLKALRNIFFASLTEPYVGTAGTTGSVLNTTQGLVSAFSTVDGVQGTSLYLENAVIGIRHLGFYGTGTAISAYNSTVTAYSDNTVNTGVNYIAGARYAVQNTLDNSPVICTSQVHTAITAKNSVIDFTSGQGLNIQYPDDFRQCTSYISAYKRGLDFTGTRFAATSVMISNVDAPRYYAVVTVPVFAGMTLTTGATAHAMAYHGNLSGYWKTFPAAKMFMHPAGGSEVEIGYVTYVYNAGASTYTTISGSTVGASLLAPNTTHAVSYNTLALYCVKTAPHGMSYMHTSDITRGITQGSGGTFTVRFYKDTAATGVSASIIIGASSVLVSGQNGVTIGYVGMPNSNTLNTANAAGYINAFYSWAWDSLTWGDRSSGAMRIRDGSSVQIEKSLIINNGGHSPVDVRRNSSLLVGDIRAVAAGYPTYNQASTYDALVGSVYPTAGNLSITGFSGKAILVSDNSVVTVATLFAKHPLVGDPNLQLLPSTFATPVVLVEKSSSASFSRVYAVTHTGGKLLEDPTGAGVGLWTSLEGRKWGSHHQATDVESMLRADSGSSIYLSSAGSMFAFDGGTANMHIPFVGQSTPTVIPPATEKRQYAVFGSHQRSTIVTDGSEAVASSATNTPTATRTVSDTRAAESRKIMTRSAPMPTASSQYLYGAPTNRTWLGTGVAGTEHNYIANPTNVGALGAVPAATVSIGITYSAVLTKGGSITN